MKKVILLILIIGVTYSCSKDNSEEETREFVAGEVIVGIKSGTDITDLFKFINLFDLKVDNVTSLVFTSDLDSSYLQYVLDKLNQKNYTNDGVNWFVTGYLHYQTNQITVFPKLFGMENIKYQNDWLNSMDELELHQKHFTNSNSGVIYFKVPVGQEIEWRNRLTHYNIVDWAELNYISNLEVDPN